MKKRMEPRVVVGGDGYRQSHCEQAHERTNVNARGTDNIGVTGATSGYVTELWGGWGAHVDLRNASMPLPPAGGALPPGNECECASVRAAASPALTTRTRCPAPLLWWESAAIAAAAAAARWLSGSLLIGVQCARGSSSALFLFERE